MFFHIILPPSSFFFPCKSCVSKSLTNIISILKLSNELKLAKEKKKRMYSIAVPFKLLYLLIVLSHTKCNFNNIESTD